MMAENSMPEQVIIIGAGPAGLTAGRELALLGYQAIVLEKNLTVGGLARTESFKGFYFDMGGHRFFTKLDEIKKIWREVLGESFQRRRRLSRIYYNRRYFSYPLKPLNALRGLGVRQSALILLSYFRWQVFPCKREDTFEQWVTNRFGRRLFRTFFKTYSEKVWGIPCSELRAEWAAQRIKNLSLKAAVLSMFLKPRQTIKTLIEEFDYPRLGPGMMWNAVAAEIRTKQGCVRLGADVTAVPADRAARRRCHGVDWGGRRVRRGEPLHLEYADQGAGAEAVAPGAGARPGGRQSARLPRLPDGMPHRGSTEPFSRQLDLRTLSGGQGWPDSELQELESGHGS